MIPSSGRPQTLNSRSFRCISLQTNKWNLLELMFSPFSNKNLKQRKRRLSSLSTIYLWLMELIYKSEWTRLTKRIISSSLSIRMATFRPFSISLKSSLVMSSTRSSLWQRRIMKRAQGIRNFMSRYRSARKSLLIKESLSIEAKLANAKMKWNGRYRQRSM